MATLTVRQLTINVTASNTWTQLIQGHGGSAYTVPGGGRADIKLLEAINLGANAATVTFAIAPTSTIADDERIWPSPSLNAGEFAQDDDVQVMQAGEGLWARAIGTTPNVTFRASVLESA